MFNFNVLTKSELKIERIVFLAKAKKLFDISSIISTRSVATHKQALVTMDLAVNGNDVMSFANLLLDNSEKNK